jgi:LPXTG-motif cell wall-anchored protein
VLRYTVLRLLVFFGVLSALWLLGLRGQENMLLLVAGAALLSAVISYFGLRRFREDYSAQLAQKIEQRIETKQAKQSAAGAGSTDEDAEDAEAARGDDTFR